MEFRIYYADGSVFEGRPEDAPGYEVQCIAFEDSDKSESTVGRRVLRDWDIFIYSDGIGWHGTNKYADLTFHLAKLPCKIRRVIFGSWIPSEVFRAILHRAETDPGLTRKSAMDPSEDGVE